MISHPLPTGLFLYIPTILLPIPCGQDKSMDAMQYPGACSNSGPHCSLDGATMPVAVPYKPPHLCSGGKRPDFNTMHTSLSTEPPPLLIFPAGPCSCPEQIFRDLTFPICSKLHDPRWPSSTSLSQTEIKKGYYREDLIKSVWAGERFPILSLSWGTGTQTHSKCFLGHLDSGVQKGILRGWPEAKRWRNWDAKQSLSDST